MQNIRSFSAYATGEKHRLAGKLCQDHAVHSEDNEKGVYISVISDGHGSNRYFRSHIGSKLLTGITLTTLQSFLESIDKKLFDAPSYAMPARTTIAEKELSIKPPEADKAFRQLFASIIAQWNDANSKDWKDNLPGTAEMEKAGVEALHIRNYIDDMDIELAYGCTLLAIARTPHFWLGIQLGDGKCVAFDNQGNWSEPIPWDEQCSGNLTTSLCQPNPLDSFRYAYGTKFFPAVFIGSDGMDGAYGHDEEMAMQNLALLYGGIIKSFVRKDFEEALQDINDTLPRLSAKGISQDDISVGGILNMQALKEMYPLLLQKELEQSKEKHEAIARETEAKQEIVMELENHVTQKKETFTLLKEQLQAAEEEKAQHEKTYKKAFKEKEKSQQKWEELYESIKKLEAELNQLSDDLNFERNYYRRIMKEEEELKSKMLALEGEILQTGKNNIIEPEKTCNMVNQTSIMKAYLRRNLELAKIRKKIKNAENDAELTHLQNRVEELSKDLKLVDEQLTEFKNDTIIGDELKNNLINLFERLKEEAKKHDSISKTEGQLDDLIFTKIDESVIDIITREYIKPQDLFMLGTSKYESDSIMIEILVDFFEHEKSEINQIQNPDFKSITEYYLLFHERLIQLKDKDQKGQ